MCREQKLNWKKMYRVPKDFHFPVVDEHGMKTLKILAALT